MKQRVSDQSALRWQRAVWGVWVLWHGAWLVFDPGYGQIQDAIGVAIGIAGLVAAEWTWGRRVRAARKEKAIP